jgi:UDP-N-acetylmuramate: L-alanyl-gamma-D-glutamyl-meso-diaminopimelate ligase
MAGRHNLQNALAAVAVAGILGATPEAVAKALPGFQGVRRRMEVFLEARGAVFVDDFAHHPTAIAGTIAAARERWPERRLWVVFEPRSNTTVTNCFQSEMDAAFARADEVWLGPIHRGDRIPPETRLDRDRIVAALAREGVHAQHADDVAPILADVTARVREGDVVLLMSNGAFGGIYARLRETFQGE